MKPYHIRKAYWRIDRTRNGYQAWRHYQDKADYGYSYSAKTIEEIKASVRRGYHQDECHFTVTQNQARQDYILGYRAARSGNWGLSEVYSREAWQSYVNRYPDVLKTARETLASQRQTFIAHLTVFNFRNTGNVLMVANAGSDEVQIITSLDHAMLKWARAIVPMLNALV